MAQPATATAANLDHIVGKKLRNQLGAQLNEKASLGVTSKFAKAQLEKMGWKEGEGLGKDRQGITTHIKVVKRADGVGLGSSSLDYATQQIVGGNEWWKNSVGDTLAKLGKKKKGKDGKDKKKKKRVYTDEELFEATGGARFGMRAQTQQHGKWQRAESRISEEDEKDANQRLEWDGMKAPVVLLKEEDSSKKRKRSEKKDSSDKSSEKSTREEAPEEKAERKKRKKEAKKEAKKAKKQSKE
eukprot:Nitzschia sp. Nitz4//scaffold18_size181773//173084//173809//NITZ4_001946-RA/size181773-processed-gene-0.73-mRNA-1//-1//CDS//3329540104//5744//frame0